MEMGSGSQGASGASGHGDSLHGLKSGKKVYSGDVGESGGCGGDVGGGSSRVPASSSGPPGSAFAQAPSAAATSGSAATPVEPRRGKVAVQGAQPRPARCQVEGCQVDLTGAKAYYCRHKVCGMHSKSPKVMVAGLEQRFCQQCSRFHQLAEFDQGKRSCRRRLAGHNERRRKPPAGSLPTHFGRQPSSSHGDSGRYGRFLTNFSYTVLPEAARGAWPTVGVDDRGTTGRWEASLDTISSGATANMTPSYIQASTGRTLFSTQIPPGEDFGASDSSCALSLLSTQPRRTTATTRSLAPTVNIRQGAPLAQPAASASFTSHTWNFHETSSSTRDNPREAEQGDGHFSGELELALQGNRHMDPGHGRVYGPGEW